MATTSTTQPLSAASTMAAGTLVSRASGVARVLVLAWVLGFTPLSDAYNLANTIPNMLYDVVLGGIATATFVPVFVERLHRDGERRAWRSISAVVTISTVVLVVASVAAFALAPWIIDAFTAFNHLGNTRSPVELAQQRDVATSLLRWFSPQILFYGLLSLSTALLNVRGRFGAPAWVPIVNNLVCIGVLLWFGAIDPAPSLASVTANPNQLVLLGLGTTLGVALQALCLGPSLVRAGGAAGAVALRPARRGGARGRAAVHLDARHRRREPARPGRRARLRLRHRRGRPGLGLHLRLGVHADALRRRRRLGHGRGHPRALAALDARGPPRLRPAVRDRAARHDGHHPAGVGGARRSSPSRSSTCSCTAARATAGCSPARCSRCSPRACLGSRASSSRSAGSRRCSAPATRSGSTSRRTASTSRSPSRSGATRSACSPRRCRSPTPLAAVARPVGGPAPRGHRSARPAATARSAASRSRRRATGVVTILASAATGVDDRGRARRAARVVDRGGRGHVRRRERVAHASRATCRDSWQSLARGHGTCPHRDRQRVRPAEGAARRAPHRGRAALHPLRRRRVHRRRRPVDRRVLEALRGVGAPARDRRALAGRVPGRLRARSPTRVRTASSCVTMSSEISATYQSAVLGRRRGEGPRRRAASSTRGFVTAAEGLLALEAAQLAAAGAGVDDVAAHTVARVAGRGPRRHARHDGPPREVRPGERRQGALRLAC